MIDSKIESPRARPASGILAAQPLDHFALTVPDANVGRTFYENFGLGAAADGNALRLSAQNGTVGYLYEGPARRLHHLSFAIGEEDRAGFKAHLEKGGIKLLDPPKEVAGNGLWFADPDGNLIELTVASRRAPMEKFIMQVEIAGEGMRGAPEHDRVVRPRRMGHCLLFSSDLNRSLEFYQRFLGLRLADRSGDNVAFLYSPHGSDHHVIAFGRSDRPGFHHASFEVPNVDYIGMGAMNMAQKGYREGWGFGRHVAGSNYFHYIRDPWGGFAEYFCDIDYIPAGCAWEARDLPAEFALYLWGPPVPEYFFQNCEQR